MPEWSGYFFSWYAVPVFATATLVLALSLAVLIRERGSVESRLFAWLALSVSIWLYAFSAMYCCREQELALRWAKAAYLGVPFIPAAVFHVMVAVLRLQKPWKRVAQWSLLVSALFSLGAVWTNALIPAVRQHFWGFYPSYGWVGPYYLTFFSVTMAATLFQYGRMAIKAESGTIYQRRTRLFFLAFSILCAGSVDYLPKYGIEVYPFGYLPVLLFVLLFAQTIWKYRLVDITASFAADRILETMNEPLIVCDIRGTVCVANKAACRTFGYSEREMIGSPVEMLVGRRPEERARLKAFIRQETRRDAEWIFRTRSGESIDVSLFVSTLRDLAPLPLGYVIAARDVSERKRIEHELKTLNETLEHRVRQRTEELEAKVKELEQLNEIMMNREERILDLKEEIRALKRSTEGEAVKDGRHGG